MPHRPSDSPAPHPELDPPDADQPQLFEVSQDLLCIASLDGYFKRVNPSWERVLGWTSEELLSTPVIELVHPDDRAATLQARTQLTPTKVGIRVENRYRCKDGSYRWLSWQSSIASDGATVFGVARDVTEQRQAEQLRLVTGKLESTGVLAGGFAHDFNNLLTGFMLNLQLIALSGPLNHEQEACLQQAQDSAAAAHALTQRLIGLSSGGQTVRESISVAELLPTAISHAFYGSALVCHPRITPGLWSSVVDRGQIEALIQHLLTNAREAQPASRAVKLDLDNVTDRSELPAELSPGAYVRLRVSDDGVGISEQNLAKVFDPYFSTKPRGTQKGMGLGLTICHATVNKHRGAIRITSQLGEGTQIEVFLPATNTSETNPHLAERTPKFPVHVAIPARPTRQLVLVMDDEPAVLSVVSHALKRSGYRTERALNGLEAIERFDAAAARGDPVDAVLLDLTVRDGMGGQEVLKNLRQRCPSLPSLLMTGYDQDSALRDCLDLGFNGGFTKPFTIEKLASEVRRVLPPR